MTSDDRREEYQRLMAEREQLIEDGVPPDVLIMPLDPDAPYDPLFDS